MHVLPRRLAPRLILGTTLLVALGSFVFTWITTNELERQLVHEKVTAAEQLSRSITSATWHAMQAGRKNDAYEVMRSIGEHQDVEYIRMFAKAGRVAFATDPHEGGHMGLQDAVCLPCHASEPPLVELAPADRIRYFEGPDGGRRMAMLTPIENEPSCSTAACHAHAPDIRILGVLDFSLDLTGVDEQIVALKSKSVFVTVLKILVIGAFLAFFIYRFVGRPIRQLIRGTLAVGDAETETPVLCEDPTELGDLAGAFNVMQSRLREARDVNERFTEDLERKVEERTQALASTQQQLIQSDRLASMGQLAASVAHEVNNPISAVLNLSIFLQRILTDQGVPPGRLEAFRRHLGQISDETARAGRIVSDLLAFSRRSRPQRVDADLNDVVARTLDLVRHRGGLAGVSVEFEAGAHLPRVSCDRSQIEQVLLNLVLNALEAVREGGHVVVRTGLEEATDSIILQVEDDGPGISEEHLARIFDPFFTTKEGEKGVGLGLAVAYGIVDAHGGRLNVRSRVDEGTVFTVRLPLHPVVTPPAPVEESSK